MVKIREIFTSIQGEGSYVGYKQLFIRLCGCNLSCAYCDTDFDINNAVDYTMDEIITICKNNSEVHSISLTGGEPLLHTDFINDLASKITLPLYLETNGTMYEELKKVINSVEYISADIKLPSSSKNPGMWDKHDKFFEIAKQKELFAKVVFDENITDGEIIKITDLCKKYDVELILQPMMSGNKPTVNSDFMQKILNKCLNKYSKTRLIPQVHKFIDVI